MRMWMINPKVMCRQHLLGEHLELHMFLGTAKKGISMIGYAKGNLLEWASIYSRHEQLVSEMKSRGYNHHSPMSQRETINLLPGGVSDDIVFTSKVNTKLSLNELLSRCKECKERYYQVTL